MRKTRLAYIGLGHVVEAIHLPALAGLGTVALAGGCDSSAAARARWEAATGTPACTDVGELLDRTRPDAVVVATPPTLHAGHCIQALAHDLNVICEKPLAMTVAEVDAIAAAAERRGLKVAVNHHFRYQPIFDAVKRAVVGGDYGQLVFTQIGQLMNLPPWDEAAPWRSALADRALLEGSVHFVDLLLHLYEAPVRRVTFRRSAGLDGPPDADAIQLLTLEFDGGRIAQLTVNRICAAATRYAELRAECEAASLRASAGGRAFIRVGKKRAARTGIRLEYGRTGLAWLEQGLRRRILARNPARAEVIATRRLLDAAISAFTAGAAPPCEIRQARAAIAVIEEAYRSGAPAPAVALARPGGNHRDKDAGHDGG